MDGQPLDPQLTTELRRVLTRSVHAGAHGDELKALLSKAATDARTRGVQAEQLLVALKDMWYSLPALGDHSTEETRTKLLQQLISRCIQEYYAS